ncbi:MAG TPA: hypothetical protein VJC07_05245 [Candidatus Nanoarchaeia archaeon]|nr:hypothetical protein [Candidatus Nanoarchaeia archaeon]
MKKTLTAKEAFAYFVFAFSSCFRKIFGKFRERYMNLPAFQGYAVEKDGKPKEMRTWQETCR